MRPSLTTRREFLRSSAAAGLIASIPGSFAGASTQETGSWDAGPIRSLLPAAGPDRFLIKASLEAPLDAPPILLVDGRRAEGVRTDSLGRFWAFHVTGLEPGREYSLQVRALDGEALSDAWPLATMPAPDAAPEGLRVLVYTCAGGHEVLRSADGGPAFLPLDHRRRILRRALEFRPDAVIAIGDHVYWDLRAGRSAETLGGSPEALSLTGEFDRSVGVLGTANEDRLHRAVGPQVAELYGTLFRSTPVFFPQDDHDYFENDHADSEIVTFPPDDFMRALAGATQRMYYPEFLPDPSRPARLGGSSPMAAVPGVSQTFGTMRFGRLAEILIYDCRRGLTLDGPRAGFIEPAAEDWLLGRMSGAETRHTVHVPTVPPGWSAGKWGEWYADVLVDGVLETSTPKPYWQEGWRRQHDRLVEAASRMTHPAAFVSGDLHAIAMGRILGLGGRTLDRPVPVALAGPVGTGSDGWPSAFRGVGATVPRGLRVEEEIAPDESHGFTLIDFEPGGMTLRFFRWAAGQPVDAIDTLEPFHTTRL